MAWKVLVEILIFKQRLMFWFIIKHNRPFPLKYFDLYPYIFFGKEEVQFSALAQFLIQNHFHENIYYIY